MNERKAFMRDIYSKYWLPAREKEFGFLEYDKNLCKYIDQRIQKKSKVLEVAIGTGYPFGGYFLEKGHEVHGIDIAPILVERCRELYPKINAKVGDAENIDYLNDYFDLTYCFHSTFYFPNLNKAIDEMLRLTHGGGMVVFDIQNRDNKDIAEIYRNNIYTCTTWAGRTKRFIKNIAKIILRRGTVFWGNVIHEVPTYPEEVLKYLKNSDIKAINIIGKRPDNTLVEIMELSSSDSVNVDQFSIYRRLVFSILK